MKMKEFLGKQFTKKVPFMGEEVEIKVLTVGSAREIEDLTKKMNKLPEEKRDNLELLRKVIRMAVIGAEDLTDDELDSFPVSELTDLSQAIMGVGSSEEGNA
jgi:DNA-binding transcriptional regulator/RsmH inhibitor MraZ